MKKKTAVICVTLLIILLILGAISYNLFNKKYNLAAPENNTLAITKNTDLDATIKKYASFSISENAVLNMNEGVIMLDGDKTTLINSYISKNNLSAYHGIGTISVSYDKNQNLTLVQASPTPKSKTLTLDSNFDFTGGTMNLDSLNISSNGKLNLERGMILIKGNYAANIDNFIKQNKIVAYTGSGSVLNQYVKDEDLTMVTASKHPGPIKEGDIKTTKTIEINNSYSFEAIQKVFDSLKGNESSQAAVGVKISFAPGSYALDPIDKNTHKVLNLSNLSNIVIEGNGSSIIMKSIKMSFFNLINCKNVVIQNFNIDYDPLPFTQGIVSKVNKTDFEVKLDKNFPLPDADAKSILYLKDPRELGLPKAYAPNSIAFKSISKLDNNDNYSVKLGQNSNLAYFSPGDAVVLMSRVDQNPIFAINSCNGITMKGINIYSAPGASYSPNASERVSLINCADLLKAGRMQVSGADGVITPQAHTGLWIEGCSFEALGDDNLIVKNKGALLKEIKNSNTFVLVGKPKEGSTNKNIFPTLLISPKDKFIIFDPKKDNLLAQVTVKEVSSSKDKDGITSYTVTTNENISLPLEVLKNNSNFSTQQVWFNDSTAGNNFVFKNNIIKYARRYAMAIMGNDGLIENNYIYASEANAISLHNDGLFNGFAPENTLIRFNTFKDNFRAQTTKLSSFAATIGSALEKGDESDEDSTGQSLSNYEGITNLVIEHNKFQDWRYFDALNLKNVTSCRITNNSFTNTMSEPLPKDIKTTPISIRISTSSNFLIDNNSFSDIRNSNTSSISIDKATSKNYFIKN